MILVGAESLASKALNVSLGLAVAVASFWISPRLKPTYAIVLGLGSGEEIVYSTKDKALAEHILAAVQTGLG